MQILNVFDLIDRKLIFLHMGICERYSNQNKNYKVLYKLNEGTLPHAIKTLPDLLR